MKLFKLFAFFIIITVLLMPSVMYAQSTGSGEVIRSFHSKIIVNKDGFLTVTETIDITSTGDQIKHGIYRDFPTKYGQLFGVVSVRRNGKPIPWTVVSRDNGRRIYLGAKDITIPAGKYSFELTYKTDHQLGFYKDHNELYWNVTGSDWAFPILKASATVILPSGIPAKKIHTEGYTGTKGAKGHNYTSRVDSSGQAIFASTKKLPQGSGFTIVVTWPKGYIKQVEVSHKIKNPW